MVRRKISQVYRAAHSKSREHIYQRPYILPILGLLFGSAIVFGVFVTRHGHTLQVSDYHIVYLFDNGKRRALDTNAKTVGDLVGRLSLQLTPQDVVEPSLDTKIVEDNYRVNVYRARPVLLVDNGVKQITLTAQLSPRVIAENAGIKLYAEDQVSFAQGDIRSNSIGEEVVIDRSIPVNLSLYGTTVKVRTLSKTVNDLLNEKGYKIAKGDTIKPAINSAIQPDMTIEVIHNGVRVFTTQELFPPPVQYVTDNSLSFGAQVVRQKGSAGKRSVTYQIVTKRGKVVSRKIIQSVTIEAAVPQIIARGSVVDVAANKQQIMAAAGISSGDYGYVNFVISHESGWNPSASNAGGCLGLGQACPGSKLTAVCSLSDPVCQLRYFTGYANGRYGGWGGAYNFWLGHSYW